MMRSNGVVDIWDGGAGAGNGQEAAVLGLHDFYGDQDKPCTRVCVREEMQAPLERSRLYLPLDLETTMWLVRFPFATWGWDADGREYVEY